MSVPFSFGDVRSILAWLSGPTGTMDGTGPGGRADPLLGMATRIRPGINITDDTAAWGMMIADKATAAAWPSGKLQNSPTDQAMPPI